MKAFVFPGQGSQFVGMGKELYDSFPGARELFNKADAILGFDISSIMFDGTVEDLKKTKVTQPSIYIHSVIALICKVKETPDAVAGHSLGEISALVANKCLSFEKGLEVVASRSLAMQHACEKIPSTMAVVLGMEDEKVVSVCHHIPELVGVANFNCPGQVVISGTVKGVELASKQLTENGARKILPIPVGGAFHSTLMEPAIEEFAKFLKTIEFHNPICPVYQNIDAKPYHDSDIIKMNLITQITSPVRWTETIQTMAEDGYKKFIEIGPGKVLQGLIKKISPEAELDGVH